MSKLRNYLEFALKKYEIFLFVTVLFLNLFFVLIGWNHSITDLHGFRQSQTLIPAFYFLKEGFSLNYLTPVFGYPWSLPMELPIYQGLVAIISFLFSIDLIISGRTISILSFYTFIFVLNLILKQLFLEIKSRLIVLSVILASPVYIFWSRTTIIEPLTLALGALFIYFLLKLANNKFSIRFFILALIFSALCILVKSTTYMIILFPAICAYIFLSYKNTGFRKLINYRYFLLSPVIIILISFAINFIWISHTDALKLQNPLTANFLDSSSIKTVYFGTAYQKLSTYTWDRILYITKINTINQILLFLLILSVPFIFKKKRGFIFIALLGFISGPAILTNVYFVHEYYHYANTFFLLIAVGIGLSLLNEQKFTEKLSKFILIPLVLILMYSNFFKVYLPYQKIDHPDLLSTGKVIKSYTDPSDVVLIYGFDWSSEIPFYSERKAIMDRWNLPLSDPKIQKSINSTGKNNIKAMFSAYLDQSFLDERISYFGFKKDPVFTNYLGALYIKDMN